ncbi:MAG TPA: trehalose-phosphatase, partial [Dehalococcoidia bacterium]|nr:trehalose-phosphatase [Dehalococcoidia bacterium]
MSRIVPNPPDALVSEAVKTSLRRLLPRLDLLGVVTGRESEVARRMVGVEGLAYVGSYALRPGVLSPEADASVDLVRQAVQPYLERLPCVGLETKDVSFALHFRNCSDPAGVRARLISIVEPLVVNSGTKIVEGKQVIEVVPRELPDKGSALAGLLAEHAIDGAIFMGDDLGDTAAFREIRRRRDVDRHPGLGIAVVDTETPSLVREYADVT